MNTPCSGRESAALRYCCAETKAFSRSGSGGDSSYFTQVRLVTVAGAGHWLHHDKLDEVLEMLGPFLTWRSERQPTPPSPFVITNMTKDTTSLDHPDFRACARRRPCHLSADRDDIDAVIVVAMPFSELLPGHRREWLEDLLPKPLSSCVPRR